MLRRDLVERLAELLRCSAALEIHLLTPLAQRHNLTLLEVGLREDLAVHLDENLLDDFGAHRATAGEREEADEQRGS